MVEGFIKNFFNWVEEKSMGLLWKKIFKPVFKFLIGWLPPYKDDI